MSRPLLLALVALAASAGTIETASADRRERVQERRSAIVAGAVRKEVATERAQNRYQECVRGSGYDTNCERQRDEDEREARAKGRRTAIIVGSGG